MNPVRLRTDQLLTLCSLALLVSCDTGDGHPQTATTVQSSGVEHQAPPQPATREAEPSPHTLTPVEVEEHIGGPARVTWIKAASLFVDGVESCVDGRDDHAVIGTPGGDAGELLLALAAVESLTGHELTDDEVRRVFEDHLQAFGDFYLHSDDHAMDHLIDALSADPAFAGYPARLSTPAAVEQLVRHPPPEFRDALLGHLLVADGIGCGHLKLVASQPDRYHVRPALLRALLEVYYRDLWTGREGLRFEVLAGEHAEGAVVNVHLDGPVHPYTKVPLIEPLHAGTEVFVNHPEVVQWLRRQRADFMHEEEATLGVYELEPAVVAEEVQRLGDLQMHATCDALANALPHYDVYVDAEQLVVR